MKIREFLLASAVMLTALFVSCKENELIPSKDGAHTVAFTIAIPKGDPVTYAIHDIEEWTLESLWLYEFNADGSKLLTPPVNIAASLTGGTSNAEYTYKRKITPEQKGSRRFVFVANEEPAGIVVGSTMEQLKALLAQNTLATGGASSELLNTINTHKRIPMTGEAMQNGSPVIAVTGGTAASSVRVEMTRIVARIDVQVYANNLKVTDLKLRNTNDRSHLFLKSDYQTPAGTQKVNDITTFNALSNFDPTSGLLKKAFYLYEGHQPSKDQATKVIVTAELGGVPVVYPIPFWNNTLDKEIVVKRNHLYTIELGDKDQPDQPGTTLTFTIKSADWNEILLNETFDVLTAAYSGSAGTYNKVKGKLEGVLTLDAAAHSSLTFNFENQYAAPQAYTANVAQGGTWLTASPFSGNTVSFSAAANTTGKERTALIEVSNNVDPQTKFIITVKQAG